MSTVLTIERNGLDIEQVSPDKGAKYSPNLYRWLKGQKSRAWALRVYRCTDDVLWIGILDGRELIGSKLLGVLCNGKKERTFAWQHIDAVEVVGFWERYVADGRCAIDTDHSMHFQGDDTRWHTVDRSRSCNWCGKSSQTFKRWTETVDREDWVEPKGFEVLPPCHNHDAQGKQ
ncbi:hypothetical protein MCEMSEM18_03535 [Comamonadaceae bacterium]